jgi:hypothetical protein
VLREGAGQLQGRPDGPARVRLPQRLRDVALLQHAAAGAFSWTLGGSQSSALVSVHSKQGPML